MISEKKTIRYLDIDLVEFSRAPSISRLKRFKKKNPLDVFWDEILNVALRESVKSAARDFSVSDFWVDKVYADALRDLVHLWARGQGLRGRRLETSVGMHFLDWGPASFRTDVPGAETGVVYMRRDPRTD